MSKLIPALLAEAIGVFALTFVGILAIHQLNGANYNANLVGVALAHGLILSIVITAFAAISGGHINPAVTIGLCVLGKISPRNAFAYIIAQVIGGIVAALAVVAIIQPDGMAVVANGTPAIPAVVAPVVTLGGAFLAEFIATFFLMTAVLGTAVDPRAPKIGGFGVGLTVTADILAIGPLTGAAMNPARASGPAIVAIFGKQDIHWEHQLLYWMAPIAGAVVAALLYKFFFAPDVTAAK